MLYIVSSNGERGWHIGYSFPEIKGTIIEIQADCDELEHIRRNFTGIPFCNSRVVKWTGVFAQFIYDGIAARERV